MTGLAAPSATIVFIIDEFTCNCKWARVHQQVFLVARAGGGRGALAPRSLLLSGARVLRYLALAFLDAVLFLIGWHLEEVARYSMEVLMSGTLQDGWSRLRVAHHEYGVPDDRLEVVLRIHHDGGEILQRVLQSTAEHGAVG